MLFVVVVFVLSSLLCCCCVVVVVVVVGCCVVVLLLVVVVVVGCCCCCCCCCCCLAGVHQKKVTRQNSGHAWERRLVVVVVVVTTCRERVYPQLLRTKCAIPVPSSPSTTTRWLAPGRCVVVEWLYYSKRIIIVRLADLSDFSSIFVGKMCSFCFTSNENCHFSSEKRLPPKTGC